MRALVFETVTGKPVDEVETLSWSYDTGILAADKVTVSVPAYTPRAKSMDLRALLAARKHSVALIDDSIRGAAVIPAAGSVEDVGAGQDDDGNDQLKVTCYGPERVLSRAARVRLFPGWPLIGADLKPTGTFDVSIAGVEYGTMMKRLIVEAAKFPGGVLPLDFEADRAGTREKVYEAVDGKELMGAIDDISDLVNGVEYDFRPYLLNDESVRYRFVTAGDAVRFLSGPSSGQVWNLGGSRQDVRAWIRDETPAGAATDAIFTGGKSDDAVLLARASSPDLIDAGWPRVEAWDSSHSSVSELATLQGWADGALSGPTETASCEVRVEVAPLLRHGDEVTLAAQGHWDMPDGETVWRVLSVGRTSAAPDWLKVDLVGGQSA